MRVRIVCVMRVLICHVLALALLYLGAEGAWDMTIESHAHAESEAHQLDTQPDSSKESSRVPGSDKKPESGHCSHPCHGHASAIAAAEPFAGAMLAHRYALTPSDAYPGVTSAPPTPPPNA